MKLITLLAVVTLAGCTVAVPIKRNFPSAPETIMEPCPDLDQVAQGTTKMSEALVVITNNYSKYHQCQIKQETWIEWYTTQKKIFEEQQ